MPQPRRLFEDWDWDEFGSIAFGIVFGTIFVGLFLVLIGILVNLLWTSGLGWLIIGFVSLVGVALLIAAIVQIVKRVFW